MFNSHIVEQAKIIEYIDTGLRMAFRNEWAIAGIMASQAFASIMNFFVVFIRAARVTSPTTATTVVVSTEAFFWI